MTAIAATMQAFFTERLIAQRRASPHTITAYRDTWRLLLGFAAQRTRTPPCRLDIADLDAPMISAFLDHLEHQRGNTIRSRNARLAAIHSLFSFAALLIPSTRPHRPGAGDPAQTQRPDDRHLPHQHRDRGPARRPRPGHPDRAPRPRLDTAGHPDRAAGLRLTALTGRDVHLGAGAHVACHGKGRKDRITPLTPGTVTTLRAWLAEHAGTPDDPLFTTIRGGPMSHDALQQRLTLTPPRPGEHVPP